MSSQRYHEEEAELAYFNTVSQHRKASRSARKRGTGKILVKCICLDQVAEGHLSKLPH